jgi:tripartite-type tricarboxylate transporter receptor subunit TctC
MPDNSVRRYVSTGDNLMHFSRRNALQLTASAFAMPLISRPSSAQSYPNRPVKIVVGFVPGGTQDIVARLIGQWLSERLGQPFIVENRPGAGGNIGAEAVVNSRPDGYTIVLAGPPNAINATLYDKLNFNFLRDIAPVAGIIRMPNVVAVHPSVPAKTVPEFIAYVRAHPGKVNMASAGNGSSQHVSGELFKMMAGVDMTHVPYRGAAPAITDLIGGQVQVMFDNLTNSIEYIKTGKLRGLAVTTALRSEMLPNLPTVAEFVSGYEASASFGLGVPKNTPRGVIEELNKEINVGLNNPTLKVRLAEIGGTTIPGSPSNFGKLMTQETEKWGKVVKFSGAKVD